jgi:thymidine phosphorylase
MRSYLVAEAYSQLERGLDLPDALCIDIQRVSDTEPSLITLAVRLLNKDATTAGEKALLAHILDASTTVHFLISHAYPDKIASPQWTTPPGGTQMTINPDDEEVIHRLRDHREVGVSLLGSLIDRFLKAAVPVTVMALTLAMIAVEGLSASDVTNLTVAMLRSGDVFDYRPLATALNRRLVRRYPTGGLSEKVSLILPSVLAALSEHIPLLSITLVGRSLGFTGGTLDKLGSIPGFSSAIPGQCLERVLAETHVAICATGPEICPADRELYSLRSETGTIVSQPLIVSSICSKHLALPVHRLLLDVRFGTGAFMRDKLAAEQLANGLCAVLTDGGIVSQALLTGTKSQTGVAIGNVVEVAEALAVMGAPAKGIGWNEPALQMQQQVVKKQVVRLLAPEFTRLSDCHPSKLDAEIDRLFASGSLLASFNLLLRAHRVTRDVADRICAQPDHLITNLDVFPVRSGSNGRVAAIDQVGLGTYVNFGLRTSTTGETPGSNRSGVVVQKLVGDHVRRGEKLATAFVAPDVTKEEGVNRIVTTVRRCFRVDNVSRL